MKNFIYTFHQGNAPKDGSGAKKTVKLWLISKNKPVFVGEMTDTYIDENQLVMQLLEAKNALPKKYFERSKTTSSRIYSIHKLREEGIADITCL